VEQQPGAAEELGGLLLHGTNKEENVPQHCKNSTAVQDGMIWL